MGCGRGLCHALPALAGVRKTADYAGLHPAGSDSMPRALRMKTLYPSYPPTIAH